MEVPHSDGSGVWLLVRPECRPIIALPVPRQAGSGLARAVLAMTDDDHASWDRFRDAAATVPAVAIWLLFAERLAVLKRPIQTWRVPPEVTWASVRPGGGVGSSPVAFFAADLISSSTTVSGCMVADPAAWPGWLGVASPQDGASAGGGLRATAWLERLSRGDYPPTAEAGSAVPTGEGQLLLAVARLVTEHVTLRERFQETLEEARLEAIRELAYGAGHEINNPLANITTRAQTLLLDERVPDRRRRLSTIVDQAFRARDMIGGLMLFARPPRPVRAATDVGRIVAAVVDGINGQALGRGVRVEYSPPPAPLAVFVDQSQVEEALRAVAANAIEAVADGGRITLAVFGPGAESSRVCEILVEDDGRGMEPAVLRRAFDPFFSGREAGRGAGLGLSKAWKFLEANGGGIALESRPGQGTRAWIRLPLVPAGDSSQGSGSTNNPVVPA